MPWFKKVHMDNTTGSDSQPGALEATMHWGVIWPRAIALAWEDSAFHAELKANPRKAIMDKFGYELMPDLDLTVEDAPAEAAFDPSCATLKDGKAGDPWSKMPQLKLTLAIPPKPAPELQAVAITAYQDTGRTYPFSCC